MPRSDRGQAGRFLAGQRFALVLIGHSGFLWPSCTIVRKDPETSENEYTTKGGTTHPESGQPAYIQLLQPRLRVLQIACVKAFGGPGFKPPFAR